ncbi:MAG: hypothetical protein RLZZ127_2875, partial [Planctomycetota bacterium]
MSMTAHDIRIGTMAGKGAKTADYIRAILPQGFECFEVNFWKDLGGVDLGRLAADLRAVLAGSPAIVSCLGVYANPLLEDAEGAAARQAWEQCIDHALDFGCDLVCGFTGALPDKTLPDNLPRFTAVWEALARRAADRGVRLAFENCPMGGTWKAPRFNLATTPDAWDLLFAAVPGSHLGLEWEPCHQLCQLIDPIPQLRRWTPRIFHIHGK